MDHTGAAELVHFFTIIPPRWHLGIHYQCHRWRAVDLFWQAHPTQWQHFFLPNFLVLGDEITLFHPERVVQY